MASALERLRNKNIIKEEPIVKKEETPSVIEEQVASNVAQHGQRLEQHRYEQPVYEQSAHQQVYEQHRYEQHHRVGYPGYQEAPIEREVPYQHVDQRYNDSRYNQQEVYPSQDNYSGMEHQSSRPLDVVKVPSKTSYAAPDKVGLSVIGVNDPTKVRLIKPAPLDVQPLVLNNIRDTTGAISNRLFNIMKDTGCAVLPLRECNVFDSITSIPDFEIIQVRGKKYASYCGLDYPTTFLDGLIKKITDKILIAQPYGVELDSDLNNYTIDPSEAVLSRKVQINGSTVEVPSLCISQLNYIYAYFRNYNCNVIDVTDDFPRLVVGIDLEGIPCDVNRNSGYGAVV